jgi:hypothetical protein
MRYDEPRLVWTRLTTTQEASLHRAKKKKGLAPHPWDVVSQPTDKSLELHSAGSVCTVTVLGRTDLTGCQGRVRVRSEMEACVELNWGPRSTPWQSTGGGLYHRAWWRAAGSPCCRTAQWHNAVCRADSS